MPTIDEIRNAIVGKLDTVPGIGNVHAFERFSKAEKDFRVLYEAGGKILGWNLRRVSRNESAKNYRHDVINVWRITGFMSFDDASSSELFFDNLIEKIVDAFRDDEALGGIVTTTDVEDSFGIQLIDSGPVMFAGVLCHSARLELKTRHLLLKELT